LGKWEKLRCIISLLQNGSSPLAGEGQDEGGLPRGRGEPIKPHLVRILLGYSSAHALSSDDFTCFESGNSQLPGESKDRADKRRQRRRRPRFANAPSVSFTQASLLAGIRLIE
jgi:hypothetical protein